MGCKQLENYLGKDCSRDAVLIAVEGHGVMAPERPDFDAVSRAIRKFSERVLATN